MKINHYSQRHNLFYFTSLLFVSVIHASVDPSCFKESSSIYPSRWCKDKEEKPFSNKDELESDKFNKNMRISQIRGCVDKDKRIESLPSCFIKRNGSVDTSIISTWPKIIYRGSLITQGHWYSFDMVKYLHIWLSY